MTHHYYHTRTLIPGYGFHDQVKRVTHNGIQNLDVISVDGSKHLFPSRQFHGTKAVEKEARAIENKIDGAPAHISILKNSKRMDILKEINKAIGSRSRIV